MKIAFLTPEYPHQKTGNAGGIGTSIKNLAESLVALGHTVRILVYGQKQESIFNDNLITIQQIKNVKLKGFSRFLTQKKIQKVIDTLYINKEIDIVEAADWTGITSFIQPQCPIVIKLHGSDTYFCHLDNRPVKAINKFLEKRALKKASGHMAVSKFVADTTNAIFNLNIDFKTVPNGLNVSLFKDAQTDVVSQEQVILYFGTLIRKKGVLELPLIFNEVVKANPQAKLILVGKDASDTRTGSTSTWQLMQNLFSHDALSKVSYVGGVPYTEVKKYIQQATVCIFPSFAEAFPVSWLEAMAMKKAIVASNIGWATEMIVSGQEGILIHPKDHANYSKAIVDLLNSKQLREQMGANALKKIENNFTNIEIAKQNVIFYQSIIK